MSHLEIIVELLKKNSITPLKVTNSDDESVDSEIILKNFLHLQVGPDYVFLVRENISEGTFTFYPEVFSSEELISQIRKELPL